MKLMRVGRILESSLDLVEQNKLKQGVKYLLRLSSGEIEVEYWLDW